MKKMRKPLRRLKPQNWEYKAPQQLYEQTNSPVKAPSLGGAFQLYLLAKPQSLKQHYIQQVPYFWVHQKLTKQREYQLYYDSLRQQLQIYQFPYVDNLLQAIDDMLGDNKGFKIICQAKHLERIFEFHRENQKLISVSVFDDLAGLSSGNRLLKSKKIDVTGDKFEMFKRMIFRNKLQNNQGQLFLNATRISNWDISEVNKSRLVLKTLLVHENFQKGKQDFVKLATAVQKQLGQVFEYQANYKIDSSPQQAIKWYSKKSFYHKLVNNTLKAGKGNPLLLSYIRFPVKQLYKSIRAQYQLTNLHQKKFQCYRGGRISEQQIQYFRDNVKGFIEMQGFLSCTISKQAVKAFVDNCVFKIQVTNLKRQSEWDHGFCFLDSAELTQFLKQQEVLFNVFSVMEIKSVQKQKFGDKVVDVITLEYGSLAAQLYKKKHGLQVSQHEKRCITNYQALKPYYEQIHNQGDCFKFFHQYELAQEYFSRVAKRLQNWSGRNKNSQTEIQLALSTNTKKHNTKSLFQVYYSLGGICVNLKKTDKSIEYFQKAKIILQKDLEQGSVSSVKIASIYNSLGIAYKANGNRKIAKQCYAKTVQMLKGKIDTNSYLATAYNNLANLYHDENNESLALKYYNDAYNMIQNQQTDTVANILSNIGCLLFQKGENSNSIKNLTKALQIYRSVFGTHIQTANTHFILGKVHMKNKSVNDANRYFGQALQMMKQLYSPNDQKVIYMKRNIEEIRRKHSANQSNQKQTNSSTCFARKQMSDVLGFLTKNDKLDDLLGRNFNRNSAFSHLNQQNKMSCSLQQQSQKLFHLKKTQNLIGQEKRKYLRGQNIIENNLSANLEESKHIQNTGDFKLHLESKQHVFNADDFIKSLQSDRKKNSIKLY